MSLYRGGFWALFPVFCAMLVWRSREAIPARGMGRGCETNAVIVSVAKSGKISQNHLPNYVRRYNIHLSPMRERQAAESRPSPRRAIPLRRWAKTARHIS